MIICPNDSIVCDCFGVVSNCTFIKSFFLLIWMAAQYVYKEVHIHNCIYVCMLVMCMYFATNREWTFVMGACLVNKWISHTPRYLNERVSEPGTEGEEVHDGGMPREEASMNLSPLSILGFVMLMCLMLLSLYFFFDYLGEYKPLSLGYLFLAQNFPLWLFIFLMNSLRHSPTYEQVMFWKIVPILNCSCHYIAILLLLLSLILSSVLFFVVYNILQCILHFWYNI